MSYAFLKNTELGEALDKVEIIACFLAALGHDLNHST